VTATSGLRHRDSDEQSNGRRIVPVTTALSFSLVFQGLYRRIHRSKDMGLWLVLFAIHVVIDDSFNMG